MELIKKFQAQILAHAIFLKPDNEYHSRIKEAFLNTPRHLYIKKYKEQPTTPWITVTDENLGSLIPMLYADRPLFLHDEPGDEFKSTISQPHIVLRMLEMLQLEPGHTVFEVGAASGWDAALMGALVGNEGHVYSAEIIPAMAQQARENIEQAQIQNVTILESDAGFGYEAKAPYDRIIFTAAAHDLPACFFSQLKDGGILLLVLTVAGGGEVLLQFKKTGDHFETMQVSKCRFVRMTGQYYAPRLDMTSLEVIPEWASLKDKEINKIPFWWGASSYIKLPFSFNTSAFRFYLGLADPGTRAIKNENNEHDMVFFGLLTPDKTSFIIAKEGELVTYGNEQAKQLFMQHLQNWVGLGMPGPANFKLKVYSKGSNMPAAEHQWIVERTDAVFVWSL